MCECRSKKGEPKKSYASKQEAQETADYEQQDKGVSLRVYQCPSGNNWHLTSSTQTY
jgi:hypothetical protein